MEKCLICEKPRRSGPEKCKLCGMGIEKKNISLMGFLFCCVECKNKFMWIILASSENEKENIIKKEVII